MNPHTQDALTTLWRQVDMLMTDRLMRDELKHVGYTDRVHEHFTAVIAGGYGGDETYERHIDWITKPLKRFYGKHAKRVEESVQELTAKKQEFAGKVTSLFGNTADRRYQAQRVQHEYSVNLAEDTAEKMRQALQLIAFIDADPGLQQRNPALEGHALDF